MREKEHHTSNQGPQEITKKETPHLSDSIPDAHASGNGAIERGKDSLIASDDNVPADVQPGDNEAY